MHTGAGFFADHVARTDPAALPILPVLQNAPIPIGLAGHREIPISTRVRAVFDLLADAVRRAL